MNIENQGISDLMNAVIQNDESKVKQLLNNGMDINVQDEEGMTALMHASEKGDVQMVQLLISRGADINFNFFSYENCDIWSALYYASKNDHLDIVKILKEAGAGIDGDLIIAADEGDISRVIDLLNRGANVNAYDYLHGATPLFFATINGHTEVVKKLIEYGANVNFENGSGNCALNIASEIGNMNIIQLLLDHGAIEESVPNNMEKK